MLRFLPIALLCLASVVHAATRYVPSQYSTIQAAVNASGSGDTIQIANGTYYEQVNIPSSKSNLSLVGETQTGVKLSVGSASQTALTVNGTDITVSYMTIENTAGQTAGPANAVRVNSQRVQFHRCYILGWQDTFAIWNNALVYCSLSEIRGSVDFIYSGGTAFFYSCNIKQIRSSGGVIAAPSTPQNVPYGFVFYRCKINRSSNVPDDSSTLMRPWREFGQTAFIDCTLEDHITDVAWSPWDGREATCRAAEYGSKTPSGASISLTPRAWWVVRLTSSQAATYSESNVLGGWNPPL
ncbi:MAG: pectinesterase family protein [Verrucomicrobiota bacterium JB022]|nr:pectinesterase family protein [Verrucomicrobiota bacterium JB022]